MDFHVAEEGHGIQAAVPIEISIWPESDSNGEEREVCRELIGSLCLLLHVSLCEVPPPPVQHFFWVHAREIKEALLESGSPLVSAGMLVY